MTENVIHCQDPIRERRAEMTSEMQGFERRFEALVQARLRDIRERMQQVSQDAHIDQAKEEVCVSALRALLDREQADVHPQGELPSSRSTIQKHLGNGIESAIAETPFRDEVAWRRSAYLHFKTDRGFQNDLGFPDDGGSTQLKCGGVPFGSAYVQCDLPLFPEESPDRPDAPTHSLSPDSQPLNDEQENRPSPHGQLDLFIQSQEDQELRRGIDTEMLIETVRDALRVLPPEKLSRDYGVDQTEAEALTARIGFLLDLIEWVIHQEG